MASRACPGHRSPATSTSYSLFLPSFKLASRPKGAKVGSSFGWRYPPSQIPRPRRTRRAGRSWGSHPLSCGAVGPSPPKLTLLSCFLYRVQRLGCRPRSRTLPPAADPTTRGHGVQIVELQGLIAAFQTSHVYGFYLPWVSLALIVSRRAGAGGEIVGHRSPPAPERWEASCWPNTAALCQRCPDTGLRRRTLAGE